MKIEWCDYTVTLSPLLLLERTLVSELPWRGIRTICSRDCPGRACIVTFDAASHFSLLDFQIVFGAFDEENGDGVIMR